METTNQVPAPIFWHEPTISWKTQEEIDQYEQQEIERQIQEVENTVQEALRLEQEELQRQYDELHKTFIHIGADGVIQNLFIASNNWIEENPCIDGVYIEQSTTDIGGQPGIGYFYNEELNAFIPPKPYESWILNEETLQWESPVPPPAINEPGPGKVYVAQYRAYILPPPDDTWIFNEEKLEWEPPTS